MDNEKTEVTEKTVDTIRIEIVAELPRSTDENDEAMCGISIHSKVDEDSLIAADLFAAILNKHILKAVSAAAVELNQLNEKMEASKDDPLKRISLVTGVMLEGRYEA